MRSRWKAAGTGLCVVASVVAAIALEVPGIGPLSAVAAPAAQPAPPGDDTIIRVQAMAAAFGAIADRASEGAWQQADQAYNDAVAMLDAQRPPVEGALGEPATAAFGRVEALLPSLEAALSAEDTVAVRTVVGELQSVLGTLAPGVASAAVPQDATEVVLAWRAAVEEIEAHGAAGRWIDMRNAAIVLNDEMPGQFPIVARAGGAAAQPALDRARIFGMRIFAASLDQSPADSEMAIAFFRTALDDLLVAVGAMPAPTPVAGQTGETRFRIFQVNGRVGDVVVVPVIGEAIPKIGLGAYSLRAAWSPAALRLVDVAWEEGRGILRRDDAAGRVDFSLPQAPTGPTGDAVLAQLRFEVTGKPVAAADYLPSGEVQAIEAAIDGAMDKIRLGSVPQAATDLTRAYADFVGGRDHPGSLVASLAAHDLAAPLADRLLLAVDLTSQAAETDRIVVALGDLKTLLGTTADAYFERLAGEADIPIALEVLSASDTLGSPLATGDPVPGGIVLPEPLGSAAGSAVGTPGSTGGAAAGARPASAGNPTVPASIATAAGQASVPSGVITGTVPAGNGTAVTEGGGGSGGTTGTASTGGFPLPLVVALALAFAIGVAAMAWSARRGGERE
jgi:hypothetical protein